MKTETMYGISQVNGSVGDGPSHWVVGKPGLSQLYYFDTLIEAIKKLVEIRGSEPIIKALKCIA